MLALLSHNMGTGNSADVNLVVQAARVAPSSVSIA
eukprot:COSAG02_NODE_18584_length_931_cov_0.485577_1_plen_34_part_10